MAASYAPGSLDSMKHPAETDEFIKIIKAERGVEDDVGAQRLFGEYAFDKGNTDDAKTHLKKRTSSMVITTTPRSFFVRLAKMSSYRTT